MSEKEGTPKKKAAMHVGVQGMGTSKHELQFLVRHGVTHMNCGVAGYDTETLLQHREEAAAVFRSRLPSCPWI